MIIVSNVQMTPILLEGNKLKEVGDWSEGTQPESD